MPETKIEPAHHAYLTRLQHLGEHFNAEKARLEAELGYVLAQARRIDTEIVNALRTGYSIDAHTTPVNIDADKGVIITPDAPAEDEKPAEPVKLRAKAQEG